MLSACSSLTVYICIYMYKYINIFFARFHAALATVGRAGRGFGTTDLLTSLRSGFALASRGTICYMIREVLKYVDFFFDETKRKHNQIDDTILKSALVYQYLYHLHFNTYISVSDVLELNDNEIGLIGPGNGCLTWFLERGLGCMMHSGAFTSIIH